MMTIKTTKIKKNNAKLIYKLENKIGDIFYLGQNQYHSTGVKNINFDISFIK